MLCRFLTIWAFTFILPFVTAHWSRRHQEVGLRARGDVDIYKRQYFGPARFTWYDVGLGACGVTNISTDFVVALSVDNFGSGYPSPQCFRWITIQVGQMTTEAQIVDECEACPEGGLDFSDGLFEVFTNTAVGVLTGAWWFNPTSTSSAWEPPTTTSTPAYTPSLTTSTSVYVSTPTTTSTLAYTPPVTSSTTSSTTSSMTSSTTSTSSMNVNTSWASGLAIPTAGMVSTPDANNPQNVLALYNILVEFGIVLSVTEKSK